MSPSPAPPAPPATAKTVDTAPMLSALTDALRQLFKARGISQPRLLGIATGGVWLAEHLYKALADEFDLGGATGQLNIGFYRDDLHHRSGLPKSGESVLPWAVDEATIVLVDDVLHSGRTARAAMNAVFDYGRPAAILLAVLVDRPGRELPIAADAAGAELALPAGTTAQLAGPEPLTLEIQQTGPARS